MGYWAPGPHAQVGFAIGRAHLLQGNLPAADQAFEKVTQLRQPRIGTPVSFVRSFYFLGHVRDQLDDGAGAREAYESFLRYWADGDIDRERVTEASAYVSS